MEPNNSLASQPPITTFFQSALQLEREDRIPLSIYLPDRDRENKPVDISSWQEILIQQMSLCFGGCSVSQTLGFWQGQVLVTENTFVIMSYVTHQQLIENISALKTNLDRFYYQTNQETLLIVLGNNIYLYKPSVSADFE